MEAHQPADGVTPKSKGRKTIIWIVRIAGVIFVLILVGVGFIAFLRSKYPNHQHCIVQNGLALRMYAQEHGGQFPKHTNGFGDAILLLVKGGYLPNAHTLTGVDDDGSYFSKALAEGSDVPEELCTRIYVQGLDESAPIDIAVLFDKHSTRGGDHFRSPWGTPGREVIFAGAHMKFVPDPEWSAFATNQIEMLSKLGFDRTNAKSIYSPTLVEPQSTKLGGK
jgi:hypothetical protein